MSKVIDMTKKKLFNNVGNNPAEGIKKFVLIFKISKIIVLTIFEIF